MANDGQKPATPDNPIPQHKQLAGQKAPSKGGGK